MMLRDTIRRVIPKTVRRKLIEVFVKHRYWYGQGDQVMASTSVISVEKITIGIAAVKYIAGDSVGMAWVGIFIGVYFIWRVLSRWLIGYFWEKNGGYNVEAEWNKERVAPQRFYMLNLDDLAKRIAEEMKDAREQ